MLRRTSAPLGEQAQFRRDATSVGAGASLSPRGCLDAPLALCLAALFVGCSSSSSNELAPGSNQKALRAGPVAAYGFEEESGAAAANSTTNTSLNGTLSGTGLDPRKVRQCRLVRRHRRLVRADRNCNSPGEAKGKMNGRRTRPDEERCFAE